MPTGASIATISHEGRVPGMLKKISLILLFCLFALSAIRPGAHGQDLLQVGFVDLSDAEFPAKDPASIVWSRAKSIKIDLLPQQMALPMLDKVAVPWAELQAIHNGSLVAFRLKWPDATRDANVDVNRFTDSAAIMFPLDPSKPASFTMGNPGGKVHIIHWKALWQEDIDKGFQDVKALHPYYWVDLYFFAEEPLPLFAEGEFPQHPAAKSFKTPEALAQLPGAYVRNPVSMLVREVPMEEAMAEGFGTFTSQPRQNATGRGLWHDGQWMAVFARPMVTDDLHDAQFTPGKDSFISIAIWDGAKDNVGARKQYSPWTKIHFEERR